MKKIIMLLFLLSFWSGIYAGEPRSLEFFENIRYMQLIELHKRNKITPEIIEGLTKQPITLSYDELVHILDLQKKYLVDMIDKNLNEKETFGQKMLNPKGPMALIAGVYSVWLGKILLNAPVVVKTQLDYIQLLNNTEYARWLTIRFGILSTLVFVYEIYDYYYYVFNKQREIKDIDNIREKLNQFVAQANNNQ